MQRPRFLLPVLVIAQFAGTALWFAGSAVMPDLQAAWGLSDAALAWSTSAVQAGFIFGSLLAAFTNLADRVSPRRLFLGAALVGATVNCLPLLWPGAPALMISRLLTGACLAGIYPVGMTLAASWYRDGLGRALGWLVGALVLGTAAPHAVRAVGASLPWATVWIVTSALAALGGVMVGLWVPDGPHRKARSAGRIALRTLFAQPRFRAAAFGYFGHMWELYALWTFVPVLLMSVGLTGVSGWSFAMIGVGAAGCVLGGLVSTRWGARRVARLSLWVSGACALTVPCWATLPPMFAAGICLVWGFAVVADSPQLSTLTAQTAPPEAVGTGMTLVTALGFGLTIVSIQLIGALQSFGLVYVLPILALGPAFGLYTLRSTRVSRAPSMAQPPA